MARLDFILKTASPWFVNGADPRGRPELRAASIRGQLRYWLRAFIGAQDTDLKTLWKCESAVFGSTGQGSPVSVLVSPLEVSDEAISRVPLLPHRLKGGGEPSPADAVKANVKLRLSFITRPGVAFPQWFAPALSLWLLLGGVGKRSRRMFGAPRISGFKQDPPDLPIENWWAKSLKKPEHISLVVKDTLDRYLPQSKWADIKGIPAFPTLHPHHSWIVVGKCAFESQTEANQALFLDLLRSKKYRLYSEQGYFGSVGRGTRRASPLIAQVRQLEDGYYPVLTFMRSQPVVEGVDWKIVNSFMHDAIKEFDGEIVWGGEFR